jgi:2-oxoglutarate dehydrogenase E2 component (dihydrolipoamide succinyltransferase)
VAEIAVVMPRWGDTMSEATIVEWLHAVGDRVERDEPLCVIETDKVDAEVVSPETGVLRDVLAQPDDVVAVGHPIATIATDSEG